MRLTALSAVALIVNVGSVRSTIGAITSRSAACVDTPAAPVTVVDVPGTPFQALPSLDGCWVFASIPSPPPGPAMLALFRRTAGTLKLERTITVDANPSGMALTHDGALLIVAAAQRVAFVDVAKFVAGQTDGTIKYLDEPTDKRLGRVYANVSNDDKFAFIADEGAQTISVIDLAKARASNFDPSSIVGKIPTGASPIALTISPDGSTMYTTSQRAPSELGWAIECKREGPNADTTLVNPQGAVQVIDVKRATTDAAHSVMSVAPAGCNPVRLVLSPKGDRAYVTARNSNSLLVFDTNKLRNDPTRSIVARVPVGTAPVGVAVVDDGRKVIVTNSNRFGGTNSDRQSLTVVDATKVSQGASAILGSIPAGAFPREMRTTPDGRVLVLTNFASKSIQLIDLAHLPIEPGKP